MFGLRVRVRCLSLVLGLGLRVRSQGKVFISNLVRESLNNRILMVFSINFFSLKDHI